MYKSLVHYACIFLHMLVIITVISTGIIIVISCNDELFLWPKIDPMLAVLQWGGQGMKGGRMGGREDGREGG